MNGTEVAERRRIDDYVLELVTAMHKEYYPEISSWEPLPDTLGRLTQIDNMMMGLKRRAPPYILKNERVV